MAKTYNTFSFDGECRVFHISHTATNSLCSWTPVSAALYTATKFRFPSVVGPANRSASRKKSKESILLANKPGIDDCQVKAFPGGLWAICPPRLAHPHLEPAPIPLVPTMDGGQPAQCYR